MSFTVRDVRKLRLCKHCGTMGHADFMIMARAVPESCALHPMHTDCIVERFTHDEILALPESERVKLTLADTGVELMRKLVDAL